MTTPIKILSHQEAKWLSLQPLHSTLNTQLLIWSSTTDYNFVGFHIGWDSYKPTDERLAAIQKFNMPEAPTLTDIRSWHGFVNQLATALVMEPFRELLRKPQGKKVYWDTQLQQKFLEAKEIICKLAKDGLTFYDKDKPTIDITDFSKVGIGFVVLQQYCSCPANDAPFCCKSGWRLALCGSRHLTAAETGYVPIEVKPWQ